MFDRSNPTQPFSSTRFPDFNDVTVAQRPRLTDSLSSAHFARSSLVVLDHAPVIVLEQNIPTALTRGVRTVAELLQLDCDDILSSTPVNLKDKQHRVLKRDLDGFKYAYGAIPSIEQLNDLGVRHLRSGGIEAENGQVKELFKGQHLNDSAREFLLTPLSQLTQHGSLSFVARTALLEAKNKIRLYSIQDGETIIWGDKQGGPREMTIGHLVQIDFQEAKVRYNFVEPILNVLMSKRLCFGMKIPQLLGTIGVEPVLAQLK